MSDASLSVLLVNYNCGAMLLDCLESIYRRPESSSWEVVIVDNASSDGSADAAHGRFPSVRLIRLSANRGFGAANNAGFAACSAPYILMLNPDTVLQEGGVAPLLALMAENPEVALVGPKLISTDGGLQTSMRNFPTVSREAFECLFLHRLMPGLAPRFGEELRDPTQYVAPRSAEWVSGAAMLARSAALMQVGGFDEGFFLYAEEIDLCKRLSLHGLSVWFDPHLTVVHVGGTYTIDVGLSLENQRSKLRYFRKHEGRLATLLFGMVIAFRLAVRAVLWGVVSVAKGPQWRRRSATTFATLLRYPSLLARSLIARDVVSLSSLRAPA